METERLWIRKSEQSDFDAMCKIFQDEESTVAFAGPYSDAEVQDWLDMQIKDHEQGLGHWAFTLKGTDDMIGQCGVLMKDYKGGKIHEIGYVLQKEFWGNGYATEAAAACMNYAFDVLGAPQVYSIIYEKNIASQNVAKRNGMTQIDTIMFNNRFNGTASFTPHFLFTFKR